MKSTTTTKALMLLMLVISGVFFTSCDPDKGGLIIKFNMEYSDIKMTLIPDTLTTGTVELTIPVNSTLEQTLQQNGASKDNIKSISLKEARWDITEPAQGTFDFLGSIYQFLGKDSLNLAQIAQKEIVPTGVKALPLDVVGTDITDALKSEKFYLRVRTSKRGPNPDTLQLKAFMKFEIIAEAK